MRLLLTFICALFMVRGSIHVKPDADRWSRARIIVDTFERMINDFFEHRDEIRAMALESSDERRILDKHDFAEHVEAKADEARIRDLLESLIESDDSDYLEYMNNLRRLSEQLVPILFDIQIIYVCLPMGTPRLMNKRVIFARLFNEFYRWGSVASLLLYDPSASTNAALYHNALSTSKSVMGGATNGLRGVLTSWEPGSDELKYLEKHPAISQLVDEILAAITSSQSLVAGLEILFRKNAKKSLKRQPEFVAALTKLRSLLASLMMELPDKLNEGPLPFIHVRRGAELRVCELDSLIDTLKPEEPLY